MAGATKTICLSEETYNELKSQADAAERTLGGQIRHLLKLNDGE